ncbi:hypothetical protein KDL45_18025, partial [bacterium]|nr:hypothetical protein [bacterium]
MSNTSFEVSYIEFYSALAALENEIVEAICLFFKEEFEIQVGMKRDIDSHLRSVVPWSSVVLSIFVGSYGYVKNEYPFVSSMHWLVPSVLVVLFFALGMASYAFVMRDYLVPNHSALVGAKVIDIDKLKMHYLNRAYQYYRCSMYNSKVDQKRAKILQISQGAFCIG